MKPSHTIRPVFDDPNLVSAPGLVPALRLAESAGFYDLLDDLSVPSPNAGAKAASVIGGMLAGADSIDDLDRLRHGGMPRLLAGVRAPSTLGTFLRTFTHGHVHQLDMIGARLLTGLTARVPELLAGVMGSRSSMSMTPSVKSTATPSREPRSATRQARAEPATGHDLDPDRRAGDRPSTAAQGQHRLRDRRGQVVGTGDQDRPRRWRHRTDPGASGLGTTATRSSAPPCGSRRGSA